MARGFSSFSAKMVTKSLLEFEFGSGNGIGSVGDVRTRAENTTAITIAAICIFLSMKKQSFQILLITFKNLIKRIYGSTSFMFSGVGKPGHPGGLITRSSVVQIYSPL